MAAIAAILFASASRAAYSAFNQAYFSASFQAFSSLFKMLSFTSGSTFTAQYFIAS